MVSSLDFCRSANLSSREPVLPLRILRFHGWNETTKRIFRTSSNLQNIAEVKVHESSQCFSWQDDTQKKTFPRLCDYHSSVQPICRSSLGLRNFENVLLEFDDSHRNGIGLALLYLKVKWSHYCSTFSTSGQTSEEIISLFSAIASKWLYDSVFIIAFW